MPDLALYLLVVAAVGVGWVLGRLEKRRQKDAQSLAYSPMDFLQTQSDEVLENLLQSMHASPDAVDVHLNLGVLFRDKGDVERAIRVHQNLFARPELEKDQAEKVQLELGVDFLSAGLNDRAEPLLKELLQKSGSIKYNAARRLLSVYESEQNWEAVLALVDGAQLSLDKGMLTRLSQACCELAQQYIDKGQMLDARKYLKRAFKFDSDCIRANFLEADVALSNNEYATAIRYYQQVFKQDPLFFPEIQPLLVSCYNALADEKGLLGFLKKAWGQYPTTATLLAYSRQMVVMGQVDVAVELLTAQLPAHPTVFGFRQLLLLLISKGEKLDEERLVAFESMLAGVESGPAYQCKQCGFSGLQMHWHCPSCRSWGTVKPRYLKEY